MTSHAVHLAQFVARPDEATGMNAVDAAAKMRALHQEMLVELMHAVTRRGPSMEGQRVFVLMIDEGVCEFAPTQPLPRLA